MKALKATILAFARVLHDATLFAKDASTGCRKRALARGLLSKVWGPKGCHAGGGLLRVQACARPAQAVSTGVRDHAGKSRAKVAAPGPCCIASWWGLQ